MPIDVSIVVGVAAGLAFRAVALLVGAIIGSDLSPIVSLPAQIICGMWTVMRYQRGGRRPVAPSS